MSGIWLSPFATLYDNVRLFERYSQVPVLADVREVSELGMALVDASVDAFEIEFFRAGLRIHEGASGLAGQQWAELAEGVPQAEGVTVTAEVALDEGPELPSWRVFTQLEIKA